MRELLYINDDIARAMIMPKGNTGGKKNAFRPSRKALFLSNIIIIQSSKIHLRNSLPFKNFCWFMAVLLAVAIISAKHSTLTQSLMVFSLGNENTDAHAPKYH